MKYLEFINEFLDQDDEDTVTIARKTRALDKQKQLGLSNVAKLSQKASSFVKDPETGISYPVTTGAGARIPTNVYGQDMAKHLTPTTFRKTPEEMRLIDAMGDDDMDGTDIDTEDGMQFDDPQDDKIGLDDTVAKTTKVGKLRR